jgi:hypothetical protein
MEFVKSNNIPSEWEKYVFQVLREVDPEIAELKKTC